jgi:hypothetical protein
MLVHQAAVLSFATLVHKVCSAKCAPETLDKYVGQYVDLFTGGWACSWASSQACGTVSIPELCCCIAGSRDYAHQMLYLEALSNFELQRVVQFLTPIIRGDDTKYSHHIRFLAMWTTVVHSTLQPDQVCCNCLGSQYLILSQLKVYCCI